MAERTQLRSCNLEEKKEYEVFISTKHKPLKN